MRRAGGGRTAWRAWLAMLFLLGLATASLLPDPWKGRTALPGFIHDCAHILAFAIAFLLVNGRHTNWRKSLLLGVGLLVFGVTLEFLEAAEFNNRLEFRDMLDDAVGVAAGLLMGGLGAASPSRKEVRSSW